MVIFRKLFLVNCIMRKHCSMIQERLCMSVWSLICPRNILINPKTSSPTHKGSLLSEWTRYSHRWYSCFLKSTYVETQKAVNPFTVPGNGTVIRWWLCAMTAAAQSFKIPTRRAARKDSWSGWWGAQTAFRTRKCSFRSNLTSTPGGMAEGACARENTIGGEIVLPPPFTLFMLLLYAVVSDLGFVSGFSGGWWGWRFAFARDNLGKNDGNVSMLKRKQRVGAFHECTASINSRYLAKSIWRPEP